MAHHGKTAKNSVPTGNMPRNTQGTPGAMEEVSAQKTNARGRTARTDPAGPQDVGPHTAQEMRTGANRPTSAGVKKRGDRRDMAPDPGMRLAGHNRSTRQSGGAVAKPSKVKAAGGKRSSGAAGRGKAK